MTSLDIGTSSSTSTALSTISVMSDDQFKQFEEDLALSINNLSLAMNSVSFRKGVGQVRCFECGELDHICSHYTKIGRA